MEEFHEADILWPGELGRCCKECMKIDAHSRRTRTEHYMPVPAASIPSLSKNYVTNTNKYMRHTDDADDFNDHIGVADPDSDYGTHTRDMVPPHILISQKHTDNMVFSVCTGHGRTLKGRDLSVMRDSIHRLTGYLEK
jgi:Senescence regulator